MLFRTKSHTVPTGMKPFSHYIEAKTSSQTEIEKAPQKQMQGGLILNLALLPGLGTPEAKPVSAHSSL